MKFLKRIFTERNLVVILFVMVFITYSYVQKESKKLDKIFFGFKTKAASPYVTTEPVKPANNVSPGQSIPSSN